MATFAGEKRKNDEQFERQSEQRRIPWWLMLLVGFALGIIFTLSVSIGRGGTVTTVYSETMPDHLMAQATLLVSEATLQAQAMQNHQTASQFDPFAATATTIIMQATQSAANP
jgi:hypothetical protein